MNHPPIPPNCPYFYPGAQFNVYCPGIEYELHSHDVHLFLQHEDYKVPEGWRPIIAAVARCAFLDLGDTENAEKWKEWGKQTG